MKIAHEILDLPLRTPFRTNRGETATVRQLIVRVGSDGCVGVGGAPLPDGLRVDTLRACLAASAISVAGARTEDVDGILGRLEVISLPSVRTAVDMALHDLRGRLEQLPLWRLLGLAGELTVPTALSVSASTLDGLQDRARKLSAWPILKVKATVDDAALTRVRALREVYGGRIWIDANGAWGRDEAVSAARRAAEYGVELLEQPVAPGRPTDLRFVRDRSPIAIVADEDCRSAADVPALASSVDAVNVKLVKCGGIHRARRMIDAARTAGLGVMLGCKTESVIGVTAVAHLASLADHVDLDGHLDVQGDPFCGLCIDGGKMRLPSGPGIGISER